MSPRRAVTGNPAKTTRVLRSLGIGTALLLAFVCGCVATSSPNTSRIPATATSEPPTRTPTTGPTATETVLPSPTIPPREMSLTAPEEGAIVTSPVEVRGRVSVMPFERTLRGRVYDAQGAVVGEVPIQAEPDVEGDLGGPGAFVGSIPFQIDEAYPGRVEVAEVSVRDGSILASASVAVTLTAEASALGR